MNGTPPARAAVRDAGGTVRRALLVLALCLPLAGAKCMRQQADVPPWESPVYVVVHNGFGSVVEVSVIGSGSRQRLGAVHPGMSGRFEVPHAMIGRTVEFEAQATIREVARSGPLNLQPGHIVEFDITAQLYNSTATILQ